MNGQVVKPTPVKASPSQQPPTALSVEALFASAEKSKDETKAPPLPQSNQRQQHDSRVLLQRLKSNPENTLEHIERQMNERQKQSPTAKLFEQDLKEKLNLMPSDSKTVEHVKDSTHANVITPTASKFISPMACDDNEADILKPSVLVWYLPFPF